MWKTKNLLKYENHCHKSALRLIRSRGEELKQDPNDKKELFKVKKSTFTTCFCTLIMTQVIAPLLLPQSFILFSHGQKSFSGPDDGVMLP